MAAGEHPPSGDFSHCVDPSGCPVVQLSSFDCGGDYLIDCEQSVRRCHEIAAIEGAQLYSCSADPPIDLYSLYKLCSNLSGLISRRKQFDLGNKTRGGGPEALDQCITSECGMCVRGVCVWERECVNVCGSVACVCVNLCVIHTLTAVTVSHSVSHSVELSVKLSFNSLACQTLHKIPTHALTHTLA